MNKEINIIYAKEDDAKNLLMLTIQVFLETYSSDGINDSISDYILKEFSLSNMVNNFYNNKCFIFIFEINNSLIGYSQVSLNSTDLYSGVTQAEIEKLYFLKKFHNYGYGTKLLKKTEEEILYRKINFVWLSTWIENQKAIKFYHKNKYSDIGRMNFKLGNGNIENIILGKKLF
jgi:diamine N-acetyltransferase